MKHKYLDQAKTRHFTHAGTRRGGGGGIVNSNSINVMPSNWISQLYYIVIRMLKIKPSLHSLQPFIFILGSRPLLAAHFHFLSSSRQMNGWQGCTKSPKRTTFSLFKQTKEIKF